MLWDHNGDRVKLIWILVLILGMLLFCAGVVYVVDPFYQYHGPILGNSAVLSDRDNQMPGSIRNFSYDSILVGNSLAENCDTDYLASVYGGVFLKVIRAAGTMPDFLYYLNLARENHSIRQVFWCMDLSQLDADTKVTLNSELPNWYLHTASVWDDGAYLFNKEILLETIPAMFANSYLGKQTKGKAYDWSEDKQFNAATAMQAYDRNGVVLEDCSMEGDFSSFEENLRNLVTEVENNPQTEYIFFLPPVSMNWWDIAYCNGILNRQYILLERIFEELDGLENVRLIDYEYETFIVCNLDNYMDNIHYSPDINQWMLEHIIDDTYEIFGQEDWSLALTHTREMVDYIEREAIYRYYP